MESAGADPGPVIPTDKFATLGEAGAAGVTAFDCTDAAPVPMLFVARTMNV